MQTETQPQIIRAGRIGSGAEDTALAGGVESLRAADYLAQFQPEISMPCLELCARGADGTTYAGPLFSLS